MTPIACDLVTVFLQLELVEHLFIGPLPSQAAAFTYGQVALLCQSHEFRRDYEDGRLRGTL
jgi:hypothetical protein